MTLGTAITAEDIIEQATFFDDWEEKYAFIIELGKQLDSFPETQKTEEHFVRGCQSSVWLTSEQQGDKFVFQAYSDAIIVKGLLAIVLAAYNGKTAEVISTFDIQGYFSQLDLLSHISNVRGNGLQAMVQHIHHIVKK